MIDICGHYNDFMVFVQFRKKRKKKSEKITGGKNYKKIVKILTNYLN